VVIVCAVCEDNPSRQATNPATDRGPGGAPQPVTVDLGDDLHNAPINGVALTRQLRQLLKQRLKTLFRNRRGRRQGHNTIMATGTDKFRRAKPLAQQRRRGNRDRGEIRGI
jgi:hypothetical protein